MTPNVLSETMQTRVSRTMFLTYCKEKNCQSGILYPAKKKKSANSEGRNKGFCRHTKTEKSSSSDLHY